ncbi:SMI1/KNR4 family protein [Chitinophaga agri]|uniref:SMI1/KNR4 family protein n=1 Tax=Chitinophaga agri TaxID=2703787 RepID=A0A6B9Z9K6_9BACT|nr:SMI1/KNR4 family protein [Chitinophaga agri]QHS58054.1 SMI1/KNR4 family protein [Chitinophaga agri]
MDIGELQQFLLQKNCKLRGCKSSDVKKIENFFNITLPSKYKDFLYAMGRDGDKFMRGSSAFYSEILYLREDFIDILQERNRILPDETFVFWSHQGYQFAFFFLNDGDDPPVYFYYEGKNFDNFVKKEESFTDFLTVQLEMSGLK